jgi:hypothetical protein
VKSGLQFLVGRKLVSIRAVDDEAIVLEFEGEGGTQQGPTVEIYHAYHEPVAVRIDGKYLPPEEL